MLQQADELRKYLFYREAMFHIVFVPKYRKLIFRNPAVAHRCDELLRGIASKCNFDLVALKVMPGHVHMAIDIGTRYGLGQMAQFHRSMGDVSRDTAIKYIENQ